MERLVVGSQYEFTGANLRSVSAVLNSALSGDQLSIDELNATIDIEFLSYDPKTFGKTIKYGTTVFFYHDNELLGKFYASSVTRVTRYTFSLKCVSAVGILDGLKHKGGLYNNTPFQTVLTDIIGGYFPFTIADDVKNIRVNNWLPYDSRRENLHQLLFAYGVVIYKAADGNMHFQYPDSNNTIEIPDNRIFLGGQVNFGSPATSVQITEHSFFASSHDQTVTLFSNTDGSGAVDHKLVVFKNPCYGLNAGGLAIHESGVNYAVVSGTGTLTGVEYSHTTKIVEKRKEDSTNAEERIVSVENATLVNVLNSENVANRVLSYYSSASMTRADIVLNNERIGSRLRYKNPFGDDEDGYLGQMEINVSSFLRAKCELIAGYIPSGGGNNFNASALLTASGSWTVPPGITKIRLIIGAAGDGGWSGRNGAGGTSRTYSITSGLSGRVTYGGGFSTPAKGGEGGEGGNGGKFYVVNLDVQPGQVLNFSQGLSGTGAEYSASGSVQGNPGGASRVTLNGRTYSSDEGTSNPSGYLDIFSGRVFSQKGLMGIKGGDSQGITQEQLDDPNVTSIVPEAPADIVTDRNGSKYYPGTHTLGPSGEGTILTNVNYRNPQYTTDYSVQVASSVSCGSGAAVGSNGVHGSETTGRTYIYYRESPFQFTYEVTGGAGVDGANASLNVENSGEYGSGGYGGNGGGGGGGSGYYEYMVGSKAGATGSARFGRIGVGGAGSRGGNGADGYLLIYY